jgi:hypothetical protein
MRSVPSQRQHDEPRSMGPTRKRVGLGLLRADGLRRIALAAAGIAVVLCAAFLLPKLVFALNSDAPTNLTAVPGEQPVLAHLEWSAPDGDPPDAYLVYSSIHADGPYSDAHETTSTSFDFTDGLGGIPYYFRVTAVDAVGEESPYVQAGPVASEWAFSPHVPATEQTNSCGLCHTTHMGSFGMLGRDELATTSPEPTAVCFGCHDGRVPKAANVTQGAVDSFSLPNGHVLAGSNSDSLVENCSTCHTAHASSSQQPMLLASRVNGVSVQNGGPALCEACHDADGSWHGSGYATSINPSRDASGYPIEGTWPGPSVYGGSTNAHRLIPESTQTVESGAKSKRAEGDCRYCHTAHGSPNKDGLRATFRPSSPSTLASDQADGTYAQSCFVCHGGTTPEGFSSAPTDIKRFTTAANTSAGHRIRTGGGNLPIGAPLPCYECHNAHGSERGNKSLLSDALGEGLETTTSPQAVRHFCFSCHTTSDDLPRGWDTTSSAYVDVTSSERVVGLPRTGGVLHLPRMDGHSLSSTISCYACHGSSYDAGGSNVHDPGAGTFPDHVSPTSETCFVAGCHDSSKNLATVHALYVGPGAEFSQYATSCELCHENQNPNRIDWTTATTSCTPGCHNGDTHANYATGHTVTSASDECVSCHGSDVAVVHGATADSAKCATCHSNVWNWNKSGDCLGCHNGADVGSHSYTPTDPSHYSESTHTATPFTAVQQGTGADGAVPAGGEECSACHSSTLKLAHASTTTSGGSVTCVECHADTSIGSSLVIASDWPDRRCTDCHATGVSTTHDSYAAAHLVPSGTCAGTGVNCHNVTDLAQLHAVGQSGGAAKYQKCGDADPNDPTACHSVLDARPADFNAAASCGEGTSGCHTDKNPTNHGYDPAKHAAVLGSGEIAMGLGIDDIDHVGWGWTTTVECSLCHYSDLGTQHAGQCSTCHSGANPVGSLGTWDKSCQQGDCHPSIHTGMQPDHNGVYTGHAASCDACHTGSPSWPGEVDCNRCHDAPVTIPDTVAPTTVSDATSSYIGDATIQLTATDNEGGRGVDRTYFILDGASATLGTTINVAAPASGSQEHTLQFYSVDRAGNVETTTPVPAFSFSVVPAPDTTPPSGTMLVNNGDAYAISITATVTSAVSDAKSGMDQMRVDPGTGTFGTWTAYSADATITLPAGDGVKTVRAEYRDNAGNVATLTDTILLDTTAPSTTSNAGGSYVGAVSITLTATDGPVGSGVASTHYRVDSGSEQTGTAISVTAPASGSVSHTIYFWSVDNATKTETEKSATFSVQAPDTVKPTTVSSFNPAAGAVYNSAQTISLLASDTGGSGLKATFYRVGGGSYAEGTSFPVSGDGLHTFSYFSADNADNTETVNVSNEFRIDTIAPVTASDITSGAAYSGAQLFTLSPADEDGSGVGETMWQLDSTTGSWTSGTSVPVIAPASGSVDHTLYWYSTDNAGNSEIVQSVPFSVSAPMTQARVAFMWEPEPYGYARLRLYDESMQLIDSTILEGSGNQLDWFVDVEPGHDYYLFVHEVSDGSSTDVDYGIWASDTSINPDGVISQGETVEWWY